MCVCAIKRIFCLYKYGYTKLVFLIFKRKYCIIFISSFYSDSLCRVIWSPFRVWTFTISITVLYVLLSVLFLAIYRRIYGAFQIKLWAIPFRKLKAKQRCFGLCFHQNVSVLLSDYSKAANLINFHAPGRLINWSGKLQ